MHILKEQNLAGLWNFTPEGGAQTTIQVPGGGWLKQGFDCEAGLYETWVTIPDSGQLQTTRLELGAVNHHAVVYLGLDELHLVKVGEDVTAFTPLVIDLTPYVRPGGTYWLSIHVRACRDGRPVAPHWADWCESIARGIFRDAFIRIYPGVFLSDCFVRTSVAESSIQVDAWITNSSGDDQTVSVSAAFSSWNGDEFRYPDLPAVRVTVKAAQTAQVTLGPVFWTPGRESWWWPNTPCQEGYQARLHQVHLVMKGGLGNESLEHGLAVRFGFREIEQSGRYYRLNGLRVNFRGDNLQVANYDRIDHGGKGDAIDTLPGFLPPSADNPGWPQAVENFLRLNFNVLREHMGPWTPYMIDTCDVAGLMLIGESACRLNGFDREDGRGFHEVKCLQDIVHRDRNHPSIIRWSTVNEPQCDDHDYHLDLYRAVKAIDDTRPVSENIWSVDYLKADVRDVFSRLAGQGDFAWFEHYLTFNDQGQVYPSYKTYNDGVIPLEDRPFGMGEANLSLVSTPAELTCYATTIARVRARDASLIMPYVLLSAWASSIPGVHSSDFIAEEGRYPVYGEDNLPDPWHHPGIKLIRQACSPYLAYDEAYWEANRKSNAAGSFPCITPVFPTSHAVEREIVVFNDAFTTSDLQLRWNIRTGSLSNKILAEGSIGLLIQPGFHTRTRLCFQTPREPCILVLTLTVSDGITERFRDESTCYQVTAAMDNPAKDNPAKDNPA